MGLSKTGIRQLFRAPHPGKLTGKGLLALSKTLLIQQLSPGSQLDDLLEKSTKFLLSSMNVPSIASECQCLTAPENGTVTVSVSRWISQVILHLGQEIYFGKSLAKVEPDMTKYFIEFDEVGWQALYQYPSILCGKMLEAKKKLYNGFERYISLPLDKRRDSAWLISKLEEEMQTLNLSLSDQALFLFHAYWSINANTRKAAFWMLSYMIFDPELLKAVRDETQLARLEKGIDINYLLDSCPKLNSVWEETMRIKTLAASVRYLTADIKLNGKILRKGNRIMIPQQQLHLSETFGDNITTFDPDRFLKNPSLKRNASFKPFGGGTTLCPGRFLAKRTTLAFVAIALKRFEIVLDPPCQSFPIGEEENLTLGLASWKMCSDIRVRICERPQGSDEKRAPE
ncbi:hypothetical protein HYFRA_00002029 [Hymenoscyphus fraxineus]|uniref:Cytochrome P450 n=1 Tax=Hymenoscyphus fraxineus TaxID=746836 RepID=A0A9N9KKZ9_9HELO|nr:hypothetical protein HYFRA_00002029 [Hymenoscyphus fraxineus]